MNMSLTLHFFDAAPARTRIFLCQILLFFIISTAGAQVELSVPVKKVAPGDTVSVPIIVKNFKNILAFTFNVAVDTTVLQYVDVTNVNLPAFSEALSSYSYDQEFHIFRTGWVSNDFFVGTTRNDGDHLFAIRYYAKGKDMDSSVVNIVADSQTPLEFLDTTGQTIPVVTKSGKIYVMKGVYVFEPGSGSLDETIIDAWWDKGLRRIFVKYHSHPASECHFFLYDVHGRAVSQFTTLSGEGMQTAEFPVEETLADGTYILTWYSGGGVRSVKLRTQ
jgi:hypothetical protein